MSKKFLFFASLLSIIYIVSAVSVAVPFITKCEPSDSKCIKYNTVNAIPIFAAGIPEYGVEQLDPLYISQIDASTPNLKLVINDAKLEGMKDCKVLKIEHDKPNSKIYLSLDCIADLNGRYDVDGEILFLQLRGNGNAHIKLRNVVIDVICDHNEKIGEDGKLHYNIKSTKYTFDLKGKTDLDLENILPGNEVLAHATRELFSNNANEIALEIGPPVLKIVVDRIVRNVNNFFHAAAIEDIEII